MELFILYLKCFLVAMIGCALQAVLKIKSIQDKAKKANVHFHPLDYFKEDWVSLTASVLTIVLFMFFLEGVLQWKPEVVNYIMIGFAFVGYTGSDVMSRIFSVVNRKINNVIDFKTTEIDTLNGTQNQPTLIPKGKIEAPIPIKE